MATRLNEMPAPDPYARFYRMYPWDEWMDGSVWQIKRGEDFKCSAVNMRSNLNSHAIRARRKIEIHKDGDTLTFRFLETI